jgi:hypothetical protein
VRVVKKTLKGNLMGKTGTKSVGRARKIPEGTDAAAAKSSGPTVRPRKQLSLDDLVPNADDLVVITQQLNPKVGKPIPVAGKSPPRTSPGDADVDAVTLEAEADLAATHVGVTVAAPPAPTGTKSIPGAAAPSPAPKNGMQSNRLEDRSTVTLARSVLAEALYKDLGTRGSRLDSPTGSSFHLQMGRGEGVVRVPHTVLLALPERQMVPHAADLAIELDNGSTLVLDIVTSSVGLEDMKARAFDAMQMMRLGKCFSVLVFVRIPGSGMAQSQAEAMAGAYAYQFSLEEDGVHSEAKFAALRARIRTWLEAAAAGGRPTA